MTDWLILLIALICVARARAVSDESEALLVALWAVINLALLPIVTNQHGAEVYWSTMVVWVNIFWMKDFAMMVVAGFSGVRLVITLSFAATCYFHQVLSWQVNTYNAEKVTLFEYRSDIMLYLSVIMLATVIKSTIGGGSDGGRRVINWSTNTNHRLYGILYAASQKVIK